MQKKQTSAPLKKYRHELKYILNTGAYMILRQRLRAAMSPDIHGKSGEYRITSLYFDDVYNTAYNDKLLGTFSRKKFRIRIYDGSADRISLELKSKDGDYVAKRSAILERGEYEKLLRGEFAFLEDERFSGTVGEDFFISASAVKLTPSVVVDYVREAYVCRAGNVRITFDKSLRTSLTPDILSNPQYYSVFPQNTIIFEVKYDSFIPSYIEELINGIPLMRESASKFVFCHDKLLEVKKCSY